MNPIFTIGFLFLFFLTKGKNWTHNESVPDYNGSKLITRTSYYRFRGELALRAYKYPPGSNQTFFTALCKSKSQLFTLFTL